MKLGKSKIEKQLEKAKAFFPKEKFALFPVRLENKLNSNKQLIWLERYWLLEDYFRHYPEKEEYHRLNWDNDKIFWGNDSTKYLEMYINGTDPLDKNKYQQFLDQFKPR